MSRTIFDGMISAMDQAIPVFSSPKTCEMRSEITEILELVREIRTELLWKAYREETSRFKLGEESVKPKHDREVLTVKPLRPDTSCLGEYLDFVKRQVI